VPRSEKDLLIFRDLEPETVGRVELDERRREEVLGSIRDDLLPEFSLKKGSELTKPGRKRWERSARARFPLLLSFFATYLVLESSLGDRRSVVLDVVGLVGRDPGDEKALDLVLDL